MLASIPSPEGGEFAVGPLQFHVYGLSYALAIFVAGWITVKRWEARGGDRELVYDVILWAIPAGIIGARIYFIITSSSEVPSEWWGPFAIWEGGLGSWGGFAAGVGAAIWRLKRAGVSVASALDAAAPAILVAHAIGRVGGNYVNQELFGKPSDLPWAVEISPANRPEGFEQYTTFQPTFFYEAIWDLALAGFLVWLERHREIRPPGLFALYVTGYSAFRIFEESLRTPLLVRWPGVVKAGSESKDIVSTVDFAETFLDAAGQPVPADMQGKSLVGVLKGETPTDWRKSFYYHYYEFPAPHRVRPHYGVVTDRYKLVHYYAPDVDYWELYDREMDPQEMRSFYGNPDYVKTTAELKTELQRLRTELKVPEKEEPWFYGGRKPGEPARAGGGGGGKKKAQADAEAKVPAEAPSQSQPQPQAPGEPKAGEK